MSLEWQPLTRKKQIAAMHLYFPRLRLKRQDAESMIWEGNLKPSFADFPDFTMATYVVRIAYAFPNPPVVRVLDPFLIKDTPHLNYDRTLCLHYAKDKSWGPGKSIAKTIVPWTLEWLLCYEIWQRTREWYGPESPHQVQ